MRFLRKKRAPPNGCFTALKNDREQPGRARDAPAERNRQTEQAPEPPKPFALPPRHTDARRVYAYLKKRSIAPQVIRGFINAGLLYEDAEHHNCVFVGYGGDGKAAFASLRGTYDRDGSGFKGRRQRQIHRFPSAV